MGFSAAVAPSYQLLPSQLRPNRNELKKKSPLLFSPKRPPNGKRVTTGPVARLFGPAIFEASKLKVLRIGVDEKKHPGSLPRTYTLTHSDITAKLTLAISNTINRAQINGWYNKLQRDEVVAEWRRVKGKMSLHVHCHISGGHFLLDLIANLRYYIFCKELPVVLKAFVHGDLNLFMNYPELEDAMVYVYFHSNIKKFHRVECWGPLREAAVRGWPEKVKVLESAPPEGSKSWVWPQRCQTDCECCFPKNSPLPWPREFLEEQQGPQLQQPQQSAV